MMVMVMRAKIMFMRVMVMVRRMMMMMMVRGSGTAAGEVTWCRITNVVLVNFVVRVVITVNPPEAVWPHFLHGEM